MVTADGKGCRDTKAHGNNAVSASHGNNASADSTKLSGLVYYYVVTLSTPVTPQSVEYDAKCFVARTARSSTGAE